ncbi:hypothetical protein AAFF_G00371470 [Aldrovandia affinis]|uniref:Uncharacterized protein n=1 Tax=Aldrovandia affinis TaxID=143900 RepID=A0AAD7WMF8_9TELE|nr:hypothetical protein AAFF_G00371470 [Aldrovandia affinis]
MLHWRMRNIQLVSIPLKALSSFREYFRKIYSSDAQGQCQNHQNQLRSFCSTLLTDMVPKVIIQTSSAAAKGWQVDVWRWPNCVRKKAPETAGRAVQGVTHHGSSSLTGLGCTEENLWKENTEPHIQAFLRWLQTPACRRSGVGPARRVSGSGPLSHGGYRSSIALILQMAYTPRHAALLTVDAGLRFPPVVWECEVVLRSASPDCASVWGGPTEQRHMS